ncbi:ribosome biogenesis protein Nop16 [Dunaliella salina]|uniref:Nucleolar protein 16 n=1 Tax=Dunaliella salina TaxID=3046 RepID=A0ABQ7H478_DUNSA|nr:ribosome biogenesis protein Nop16 [Dunaliella salina]|eukprot:KAF5841655.1 ribosome biogenesis protein Nop16 [Dunaliella salina]
MGGSRRRLKKNQPKVKVGVQKRKKIDKTRVPLEISQHRPQIPKRLNQNVDWREDQTLTANYNQNHLVMDPNIDHRSNKAGHKLRSKEDRQAHGEETFSDDDELRAGCNLERKTNKAPPPRLTTIQRKLVEQLLEKHGDDVEAMVLDTKLNKMQHSAGHLKKLIAGFRHWQGPSELVRHDFHGPQKPYKRL